MTEGLEGNRKAITSGFDKMDEVKKWDLEQLPGYEAIEEPDKPERLKDTDFYKITHRNLNKLIGEKIYPDDDEKETMTVKDILKIKKESPIAK